MEIRRMVQQMEEQVANKIEELKQQSYQKLAWLLEYQKKLDINIMAHVSLKRKNRPFLNPLLISTTDSYSPSIHST